MWLRIYAIVIKELRQLSRDRMTFGMIVMIPLVQLMLFGYAINTDARHLPAGLVNLSQSTYAPRIVAAMQASQVVDFKYHYANTVEAEAAITRGEVKAVLYLPADLASRIVRHAQASVTGGNSASSTQPLADSSIQPVGQWLVDGTDTVVAATIKTLRQMPLNEVLDKPLVTSVPSFEVVQYFNPEQRSVVNIVPGLLGVILTMTMVMFTSAAIVREREQGNMEFLITTPVRPIELMLGKILPYVLVGLIQVTLILSAGYFIFGVPFRGGIDSMALASMLFICASLTLGLVISTIAKTQLQSMQLTIFILLPSILLSGFMFPYEAMPEAAQWIAEALPATHFMRMSRAIVLRDAAVIDLSLDALWLLAFTCIGLLVASLRFNKRLD
ncbi:ABC transporter permease [Motilimonas sp. KMU-193]|uniref:ABC transporter permease n=1 Tax=Motilimonas sp. KMU-193 TaxID=3388668 RepID=UPI00396B3AD5